METEVGMQRSVRGSGFDRYAPHSHMAAQELLTAPKDGTNRMERHRLERPSLSDLIFEGSYLWLSANHRALELTASCFTSIGFHQVSNGQLFCSRES